MLSEHLDIQKLTRAAFLLLPLGTRPSCPHLETVFWVSAGSRAWDFPQGAASFSLQSKEHKASKRLSLSLSLSFTVVTAMPTRRERAAGSDGAHSSCERGPSTRPSFQIAFVSLVTRDEEQGGGGRVNALCKGSDAIDRPRQGVWDERLMRSSHQRHGDDDTERSKSTRCAVRPHLTFAVLCGH